MLFSGVGYGLTQLYPRDARLHGMFADSRSTIDTSEANAEFVKRGERVYLVSRRAIQPMEEILVHTTQVCPTHDAERAYAHARKALEHAKNPETLDKAGSYARRARSRARRAFLGMSAAFGANEEPEPQTFKFDGIAGKGGTKKVIYIDQKLGDWVLALPNGDAVHVWPRIVSEELRLSAQLRELGIPCLEMHRVTKKNDPEQKGFEGPALKMRSFDYYRNAHNAVIMDHKNASFILPDDWNEIINGEADKWLETGISYATDRLVALLTPLANDIKTLARSCIWLPGDARNWQVVFADGDLKVPSQIRVFLFDLTSKIYVRESILADASESASEKSKKADLYLKEYLHVIAPYGSKYNELNANTHARMRELVSIDTPALLDASSTPKNEGPIAH
jgi:hypothetical protein